MQKISATIININDDDMALKIMSILVTRGVHFIYKSYQEDSVDKIVVFCNYYLVHAIIEKSKDFQNFTESQLNSIINYLHKNFEEIELELTASYTPLNPKPIKLF